MLQAPMMSPAASASTAMDASATNIFGSSCGMQDLMIVQHPSPSAAAFSFDWSDFPVIHQHGTLLSTSHAQHHDQQHAPVTPPLEQSISQQLQQPCQQEDERENEDPRPNHEHKLHRKTVSWGSLEIRVHSLVLGDHPCCSGALPLQLGWEYDDTELVNLDTYEQHKHYSPTVKKQYYVSSPSKRSRYQLPPRLSYLERKNLLKRVAGMSERDLRDALEEQQLMMRHVARSDTHLCDMAADA